MRAVVVHEFGNLDYAKIEQVPDPKPAPRSVIIKIRAAPLNYVDVVTFRGEYQFSPTLPYIPGKGPAGEVASVGSEVTGIKPGDRVLAMAESGGYAELVSVDCDQVHLLPDELSFADAAAMSLAYDTAWMALRDRARVAPGDRVLVLGASGAVGQAAVQLAKAMGAEQVLAGISRPGRPMGPADAVVDLSQPDLRNSIKEQVDEATGGRGVDIVIDSLGGDPFDGAVRSLTWRGSLVIVGFAAGRIPVLKMNYPLLKNIEISGLQISDYRKRMPELVKSAFNEIFSLYVGQQINPPETETVPFDHWRSAFEKLVTHGGSVRRVLVL